MKVLIACEFSGIVRDAFIAKGHDAWSCDLLPTERPGPHIQGDVLEILNDGWDLMIAHPPCTYLAVVGFSNIKRQPERIEKTKEALVFVQKLWDSPIKKICLENPVSVLSTRFKKPSQIIQPFYFGHNDRKTTCLWLKGLPRLNGQLCVAMNVKKFIPQPYKIYPSGRKQYFVNKIGDESPRKLRGLMKAKTFPGIAYAMADQWG